MSRLILFVDTSYSAAREKSAYETSAAAKGVDFCNRIYREEKMLTELTAEERYKQRLVKIKPLLDAFFAWAEELQVSGKNKLVDAVRYTLKMKRNICIRFLKTATFPSITTEQKTLSGHLP